MANSAVLSPKRPLASAATAVTVPEPLPAELGGGVPEGTVEWVTRETDRQELRVATDRPSLLVVADNWYPAWRARVNGAEAPVLRVNHTLRGVLLEPGEHDVVLEFRSTPVRSGAALSLASLLLVVGIGAAPTLRRRLSAGRATA